MHNCFGFLSLHVHVHVHVQGCGGTCLYMSISPFLPSLSIDPDLKDELVEVIEKLLKDQTTVSRVQTTLFNALTTLFNASVVYVFYFNALSSLAVHPAGIRERRHGV